MLSEHRKKCRYVSKCFKYVGLAVNAGRTKYMEVGSHRDMMANEHIRLCTIPIKRREHLNI